MTRRQRRRARRRAWWAVFYLSPVLVLFGIILFAAAG